MVLVVVVVDEDNKSRLSRRDDSPPDPTTLQIKVVNSPSWTIVEIESGHSYPGSWVIYSKHPQIKSEKSGDSSECHRGPL